MIDTKELRRLAQAATPGPWRIGAMESGRDALRAKIEQMEQPAPSVPDLNLSDPAVQKRLAAQWGYVPAGAQDGIRWDLLPGWLIDHHEGAVLSEELLQRALAEMLAEMPKPEVQTALRERVMDAIAEALGDAYDCTRHWSAWGHGTMSQDDFSLVTDDSNRVEEIADAAIGAIGAQPALTIAEQDQINAEAAIRSIYGAQIAPIEMSITTGALSEMFLSLDGRDKAQPGYEWRKGWNDAIRQAMDYAQPAPSVPEGWIQRGMAELEAIRSRQDDDTLLDDRTLIERIGKAILAAPEAKP